MALKNHALDDRILLAARREFLDNGYENASLRKIAAQAEITVGAIYTRYPNKDALFCSLVQPLIQRISETFSTLSRLYDPGAGRNLLAASMEAESQAIIHLLFDDYDSAVLLLCRSAGSSLEHFFDGIVDRKIQGTLEFFRSCGMPHPDEGVLRMLVSCQFQTYIQIIRDGCNAEEARHLMDAAIVYHTGGWFRLLDSLK